MKTREIYTNKQLYKKGYYTIGSIRTEKELFLSYEQEYSIRKYINYLRNKTYYSKKRYGKALCFKEVISVLNNVLKKFPEARRFYQAYSRTSELECESIQGHTTK